MGLKYRYVSSTMYPENFRGFLLFPPRPCHFRIGCFLQHLNTQLIQRLKITSHSTAWSTVVEDIYAESLYVVWNLNIVMFYHISLENVTTLDQESDRLLHFFFYKTLTACSKYKLVDSYYLHTHSPFLLLLSALYISKLDHLTRPLPIFH